MTIHQTEAQMGRTYRDEHTGFEGVCTAVHFYLTGCNRASLEAPFDKKTGKIGDEVAFDTIRLIDLKTGNKIDQPPAQPSPPPVRAMTGGPRTVGRQ